MNNCLIRQHGTIITDSSNNHNNLGEITVVRDNHNNHNNNTNSEFLSIGRSGGNWLGERFEKSEQGPLAVDDGFSVCSLPQLDAVHDEVQPPQNPHTLHGVVFIDPRNSSSDRHVVCNTAVSGNLEQLVSRRLQQLPTGIERQHFWQNLWCGTVRLRKGEYISYRVGLLQFLMSDCLTMNDLKLCHEQPPLQRIYDDNVIM